MTQPPADSTRALGFWTSSALVVGNTIGVGVFVMPAALAPYGLNALTAWLITVIGCVFLAVVFAGLARAFPLDEGPYAYMQRAFGQGVAFTVLWCYWVSTWISNAAIAIGVVGYLSTFVPALNGSRWLPPLAGLLLVWLFVFINCWGIRVAGWMQVLTTGLKLLPQIAIILLGMRQLFLHPSDYLAHVPSNPASVSDVMRASTIALFAMLGIECAAIPAERVRDPVRTIPRATLTGTLVVAGIYICISAVPMLLIPQDELAASNAPFADLFSRLLGSGYGEWLALFVIISGLGALNGWTLIVGQLTQTLAKHGSFPAVLGKLNAHAAPARAFVLTGTAASLMLLLNYNQSMSRTFTFLIVVVTAANLPLYLACSAAVLKLWCRGKFAHPGPRESIWFTAAVLAAGYCIWVFIGVGAKSLLWAGALGAAGVPVHLWFVYRRSRQQLVGLGGTISHRDSARGP